MKKLVFYVFSILLLHLNIAFGQWSGENVAIDTDTTGKGFFQPKIAMNSNGLVVATWQRYEPDPVFKSILQASFSTDFGKTWSSPISIDASDPSEAAQPLDVDVALDSSNRAIIVWNRWSFSDDRWKIKAATYVGGTASNITDLETIAGVTAETNHKPHVVMNDSQNAIAVWYSENASDKWLMKSSISSNAGVNWTGPANIDPLTLPGFFENSSDIVMDNAGNALVAWSFNDSGNKFAKTANSSDNGSTWGSVNTLDPQEPVASGAPTIPNLAMDSNQNAIIVWNFDNPFPIPSFAFSPKVAYSSNGGTTWSKGENLDFEISLDSTFPQVAMDENGNAIAVWTFYDSKEKGFVKTAHSSDFGKTWAQAKIIDNSPSDEGAFPQPQVQMDDHGNAVVIWERKVGSDFEIRVANSSDLGMHWEVTVLDSVKPTIIPNNEIIILPQVVINTKESANSVNIVGIWTDKEVGISQVLTQFFSNNILSAFGDQEKVRAYLQIELINRLKTNPIGQLGTFRFYQDQALTQLLFSVTNINEIATFIDHDIKKGEIKTYFITWTSSIGTTLGPISVTIDGS